MEAWRRVEVAACEEMDGPTEDELEAIRSATFTVEAVRERERVTDHDVAAFVDVLAASAGPAGRWIHFGLTSSDVLDTALALQLRGAGEIVARGRRGAGRRPGRARPRARRHGLHRAHPRRPRRADHVRGQARGLRRSRPTATSTACAARSPRSRPARMSGAVGTYSATDPAFEARVLSRLGVEPEPVSTQVVPRDRHAELLQAIALAGAGLERLAAEIRHLQRTEVREAEEPFRAGAEGLERDAPQAQPDHQRAHHRAGPRAARQRDGRRRERRAVARARHLALGRRAGDPARLDDPARLPAAPRAASGARARRPPRPHAREPRAHARRAVLPARAAGARGGGPVARRGLPHRAGGGPARVGHGHPRCASCSRAATSASTSTRSSTRAHTRVTPPRSSRGSTRSPSAAA